jgi:hypothetical protein
MTSSSPPADSSPARNESNEIKGACAFVRAAVF